jgi:DNA polymerase-3 subunit delta
MELEKIITYAGEENLINLKSVQLVAGNSRNDSIFALTDAIGKKDMDCSLGTLEKLLYQGGAPLRTLGMITRQFRLIWQAKTLAVKGASHLQISEKIGIPSYFVGKFLSQAQKFSLENLCYVFERLLQADLDLKSSGKSPIRILEALVIDLCLV